MCADHQCPKCHEIFVHELGGGETCNVVRSELTGMKGLRKCDLCIAREKAPQMELFKENACG